MSRLNIIAVMLPLIAAVVASTTFLLSSTTTSKTQDYIKPKPSRFEQNLSLLRNGLEKGNLAFFVTEPLADIAAKWTPYVYAYKGQAYIVYDDPSQLFIFADGCRRLGI